MSSIYDIPYEDILEFLSTNKKNFESQEDAYNIALDLLKKKTSKGHTISIIEWMMARNLLINKIDIPYYNISDINNMSQDKINELAKLLKMNGNNVDNIKNILRYLHKLNEIMEDENLTDTNECDLYAGTFNYGYIDSFDDIYETGPDSLKDLKYEAINRGINISDSFSVICKHIKNELPSLNWQKQNIFDMSNQELVSEKEFKDVNDYGSYTFRTMNENLRKFPDRQAPINQTINKMQPLEKDIIVFRSVDKSEFLPLNVGDIFNSYGYLSTSMSSTLITKVRCSSNKGAVMKIRVPRGKKCIFLPGKEYELLFPHNIQLQLINVHYNKFYCFKNDEFNTDNNVVIFEFIML